MRATDIRISFSRDAADLPPLDLRAPTARYNFNDHQGVFDNIVLTQPPYRLSATAAHYHQVGGEERLDISGPVHVLGGGLRVQASSGLFYVGRLSGDTEADPARPFATFDGPIEGRFTPSAR